MVKGHSLLLIPQMAALVRRALAKVCTVPVLLLVVGHASSLLSSYSTVCIFGRPFVKRFALCYRTVVCLSVLFVLSVCDVGVLWPNGWTDQDAGRPRPWPGAHCVRLGPSSPPPKGDRAPNFRLISVATKRLDGSRCHVV